MFLRGKKRKEEAVFSNKEDSNSGFGICMLSLIQRIKEAFEIFLFVDLFVDLYGVFCNPKD